MFVGGPTDGTKKGVPSPPFEWSDGHLWALPLHSLSEIAQHRTQLLVSLLLAVEIHIQRAPPSSNYIFRCDWSIKKC